ncbi:MAG: ankyrin repeat domain-containing protein [Desulfatiglans sp.]|nr:ankyrin repeat domain-containing protein [Desulfatiglans sp.]
MQKRIFVDWSMWLVLFLAGALCSTPSMAAEFTAHVKQRLDNKDLTGRIFVMGQKYRVEMKTSTGRLMFIIVDQEADLTIVADPAKKEYMETKSSGMISLMNDPFQSARRMETMAERKLLGEENVSGYVCDKFRFTMEEKEVMTVWKSRKLDFFLKIILPDKKQSFIQLENIKEQVADEAHFQVPTGYAKEEDPRKKWEREEAALAVVTTKVMGEVPWARRIGQGGEIRVKVDPKKSVRFHFENFTKEESLFALRAFRQGQPIKMDIKETYSLKGKGRRVKPLLGMQNRADEVAVQVDKGKIIALVLNEESSFAKDKVEAFFLLAGIRPSHRGKFVNNKRRFRLFITGDSQDGAESKVIVRFYKGDYKDKIDEVETVIANGQSRNWDYPPEKGIKTFEILLSKHGGIKVRVEQPAPVKVAKPKPTPRIVRPPSSKQTGKPVTRTKKGNRPGPRLSKEQTNIVIKAINANDIATMESELDKGMDIDSTLYGGTILMKAANLGTSDMVRMLISRGADLNYRTPRDDDALSVAMSNSRHWQQLVPALVEAGIIIDEKTPIWKVAFKVKKGKLLPEAAKVLELLFSKGASPDCYASKKQSTVIMYYAKKGWLEPLKFFLDHGADVNARTLDGETALSKAMTKPRRPEKPHQRKERQAVVELLKSRGAK